MLRWIIVALLVCSLLVFSARSETNFERGSYREAVPILRQKIQEFAQQNDRVNQGIALVNLAIAYRNLGEWDLAETNAEQSLNLLSGQQLAHALDTRAKLHLERGTPQLAYDRWTQAATIWQQLNDQENYYRSQSDRSLALQNLGFYPRACDLLWETLELPNKCAYTPDILEILSTKENSRSVLQLIANLGRVLQVLGELKGSEAVLNLGISRAQNLGNPPELSKLWLNLGNTKRSLGKDNYLSALEAYNRSGIVEGKVNQISLLIQLTDLEKAKNLWEQTHKLLENSSINNRLNFVQSGIQLASKYPQIKSKIDRLISAIREEIKVLRHPRLIEYALLSEANFAEVNQEFTKAKKINLTALQRNPSADIAYLLFAQKARIEQQLGDNMAAIADYTKAVESLTRIRKDLVNLNSDVQYNFRRGVEPIYRELVSLLLQNDRPTQSQLQQARQVIDSLQLAELDNFFRDACADVIPTNIDQIDPRAAVFYPIVLQDRLELIVAIPQQPLFHTRVAIPRQILRQTIEDIRNSLRLTAFPEERIIPTTKVYNWLIRPVEKLLIKHQIETLVFVPDDSLRNLPFNILWDGSQYLLQKYNLALVPSLQLVSPKPLRKQNLRVIGAGLTEARQGFPALPAVSQELNQISQLLPTNTILDAQFSSEYLQQKITISPAPIVHLATHGQFSSDVNSTFLLTWNDRINVKKLDQILSTPPNNPIELLVLSACETAAGDDRANLGIAGVAIRSGARSTIASIWSAFDESTAILMTDFYQELIKPGVSRSQALRHAQIKLLTNPAFARPYYWAPFILLGNWQ